MAMKNDTNSKWACTVTIWKVTDSKGPVLWL